MSAMKTTKAALLQMDQFPRASTYDPQWVLENQMGPNVLWLTESLSEIMEFKPGMRVLDMGCGRAISSIFLAKEFGVQVWAADLWINVTDNWNRVRAANMDKLVFPIHTEAHAMPFADGFFDALVSMDAYHYFGTDDLYLGHYYSRLVKPGGQIGIVVPGLSEEFVNGVPEQLRAYWDWEYCSFHSPGWWKSHWEKTGKVIVDLADQVPNGWSVWLRWEDIRRDLGYLFDSREADCLRADGGQHLGFTRLVAKKL
jgi:cyclopropane fatty-acyl-phospholipid synthase-like methyltransferase